MLFLGLFVRLLKTSRKGDETRGGGRAVRWLVFASPSDQRPQSDSVQGKQIFRQGLQGSLLRP